jgi:hypothetical protein
MEVHAAIDLDALPEFAIRAAGEVWLENVDVTGGARPLSNVEVLALGRAGDIEELLLERAPP